MAKKAYEESNIAAIAAKIREKTGGSKTYTPAEMSSGIDEVFEAGGVNSEVLKALIDRSITEIEIPVGVTKVGTGAFYRASIEEVIVPEGVKKIEEFAFGNCTSLKRITLPNTLTSISNDAFPYVGQASGMDEFIIPDSVISIGYNVFLGSGAKKFVVSKNLKRIPEGTFKNCQKCMAYDFTRNENVPVLQHVLAFGNIPADCKIYVPKSLYDEWIVATNWAQYADYIVGVRGKNEASEGLEINLLPDGSGYEVAGIGECTDTDVVIPSEYEGLPVTHIRDNAFDGCSWLTSITIPNSVRLIYFRAFADCTGLTSIFIPGSVIWIDFYAFTGCSSITLYDFSTHEEPPTIDSYTFDILAEGVKIKVPKGKLAEWQSATNWCEYASYMVEAE